jgi:hypothetical protein
MNKKLIIGIVVAGLVVAGGVYLYIRNKSNANNNKKIPMASESDSLEMIDILDKKDNSKMSTEKISKFVKLYTSNIDKNFHAKLKSVISKKESDWTSQDKLDASKLIDKVIKPLTGW